MSHWLLWNCTNIKICFWIHVSKMIWISVTVLCLLIYCELIVFCETQWWFACIAGHITVKIWGSWSCLSCRVYSQWFRPWQEEGEAAKERLFPFSLPGVIYSNSQASCCLLWFNSRNMAVLKIQDQVNAALRLNLVSWRVVSSTLWVTLINASLREFLQYGDKERRVTLSAHLCLTSVSKLLGFSIVA